MRPGWAECALPCVRGQGALIPIIALTAHATTGYRERCLAAGLNDYLSKPIKSETLLRVLDALVAAGRTLRGASQPPLDLGIALGRVGGNRELLAELAQLFVEDYPAKIADVRASLDAKDARRGQRVSRPVTRRGSDR